MSVSDTYVFFITVLLYNMCGLTLRALFSCHCSVFFQAEDGIRDLVRSRGLGDVYKRQDEDSHKSAYEVTKDLKEGVVHAVESLANETVYYLSLIHI